MKPAVGLQMYTVRKSSLKDFRGTLERIAEVGYEYIEIVRHPGNPDTMEMPAKVLKKYLDEVGLKVIACHEGPGVYVGLKVMKSFQYKIYCLVKGYKIPKVPTVDEMIDYHLELGTEGGIVMPLGVFNSEEQLKLAVDKFNELGKRCSQRGLNFYYHSHFHEFDLMNGKPILDLLLEYTDPEYLKLELDAYWAERAGQDPVKLLKKYGDRCELLHVKDVSKETKFVNLLEKMDRPFTLKSVVNCSTDFPQEFTEVGTGILDIRGLVDQAAKSDVRCLLVEQDEMNKLGELESIKVSYDNLQAIVDGVLSEN